MDSLKKSNRRLFDSVCRLIREWLHIEHWESTYVFESVQDGEQFAECRVLVTGRRFTVALYPKFWKATPEVQARTLVHEHIHALMTPQTQAIAHAYDWCHEADRRHFDSETRRATEHVVDHLECVIYDLIAADLTKLKK